MFCMTCLTFYSLNNMIQKDDEVEFFRKKFAGSQADRLAESEAEAKKISEKLKETSI